MAVKLMVLLLALATIAGEIDSKRFWNLVNCSLVKLIVRDIAAYRQLDLQHNILGLRATTSKNASSQKEGKHFLCFM